MIKKKKCNITRLAIFVVYDKDGIIDDYITYYLNELSQYVSHIVIVCNGLLSEESKTKLNRYTEDVFVRENIGFYAGAIKDVLLNIYGWEKVYEYDELLFVNDSVYGPIIPLEQMFNKMDNCDCDFCGITECTDTSTLSQYIHSYFVSIKSSLLKNDVFRLFWEEYTPSNNHNVALQDFEVAFSRHLIEFGFIFSSYVECCQFENSIGFDISVMDPYNLITKYKCPFVKRSALGSKTLDVFNYKGCERSNEIIRFINENTNYDVNLIWDNLLRTCNITEIKNALCLDYILPTNSYKNSNQKNISKKCVIVVHLYYEELLDECLAYMDNIPNYINIVITTSKMQISEKVNRHFTAQNKANYEVRLLDNRGRDIAALLVGCKDLQKEYEYLCFTHDKQSSFISSGQSFRYLLFENTLGSKQYIENVICEFENNPRMGFLTVPTPYHECFLQKGGDFWFNNFNNTIKLANKLDLQCNISDSYPAFSVGTAFWCRTAALKKLFEYNFKYRDFPEEPIQGDTELCHAIERIFPYVAQHEGFYSGVVMTDRYAEVRIVDLEYILSSAIKNNIATIIFPDWNSLSNMFGSTKIIFEIYRFCMNKAEIYIYGAGLCASKVSFWLEFLRINFLGFIVSDDNRISSEYLNKHVWELSELDISKPGVGIILGLNNKNTAEVLPKLICKGVKNYIVINKFL